MLKSQRSQSTIKRQGYLPMILISFRMLQSLNDLLGHLRCRCFPKTAAGSGYADAAPTGSAKDRECDGVKIGLGHVFHCKEHR